MGAAMHDVEDMQAVDELVLEMAGVDYRYPDGTHALRSVDFAVAAGERVGLIGPNGAGKSTLAMHTNGLLRAASGDVRVAGIALADDTLRDIRRRVGFVFQHADDQLFMPAVRDDVAFGPANHGVTGEALNHRVEAAMDALGVTALADRAPHHLSGGERRRVAIATVLALRPDVLVLDEPTTGLDPASRRDLLRVLDGFAIAQVIVTHDLAFVQEHCTRTVLMDAGRMVASGPTADVLADDALLGAHRLEFPRCPRCSSE